MLSGLTTKLAMRKMGISSKDIPDFSSLTSSSEPSRGKKTGNNAAPADGASNGNAWPQWMTIKSLPLTAQAWLTPPPPPIPVAEPPKKGDLAPFDRDRKLALGGGKKVLVVFLRCVGCAFAQQTFLALRTLANRHKAQGLRCIAVSHSSEPATRKWLDLIGGAWDVKIIIDEDRALYAAWGLGLGSVWYVLNPTSQIAGFKTDKKGWLGSTVAGSVSKKAVAGDTGAEDAAGGPTTMLGNKWQQAGAWAVDGSGRVLWGGRAARADDVMTLQEGVQALGL